MVYKTDGFTVVSANANVTVPTSSNLGQNYPNPFNAVTRIAFSLPEASRVTLKAFDIAGHEVSTLVNGELQAGQHTASWNAIGVVSGVYIIVKMESTNFSANRKLVLIK